MNNYTLLAKKAIVEYVKHGKVIDVPKETPSDLTNIKAGVFVSIHKKAKKNEKEGELRGCIGTFKATKNNIAQEIIDNAISACSHDYRFDPVGKKELEDLEISVDVLSDPESISDIQTLDPKKYGILIKSKNDARSGLLLPNLEGVDTIHDQIAITLNKAGIELEEPIDIYRFTVTRYK